MSGVHILQAIDLREGEVDLVFGGPPCQGFSIIGKRKADDERSLILVEFARLATELRPKIIVAENVQGILMEWAKPRLTQFEKVLKEAGYKLLSPWCLNANEHGVPQNRRRVFLVAIAEGVAQPRIPTSSESYVAPTVKDAISDLMMVTKRPDRLKGDVFVGTLGTPSPYARRLRRPRNPRSGLTCCAVPRHSPDVIARFTATEQGKVEPVSRYTRLDLNGASITIRAGTGPDKGSFMACRPIHPTQPRCISVREAARLHGFPDWFSFDPEHWHGFRQIGNAVPPPLAEAVARAILASFVRGHA